MKETAMADKPLEGVRVAILCATDFEQAEMTEPRKALQDAGAETVLISPKGGEIEGMNHDVKKDKFKVDLALADADPKDFDAVLLPGGALNADALRVVPEAQTFVRHFAERNMPIAAICHAPWLLASAGLVRGRKLTSYHTIRDDMRNAGAEWVNQEVCTDGNLVTSRQPSDIPAFNTEVIAMLARERAEVHQRPL
ncbi:MAG TPA: type 1 glutamine amidotransferase domain-containing protein, partial [Chloroflexota bacterium]|nr:type 1 glutamine amidotransferase domain-containing protein [Chloroflexota bacterium]